MYTEEQAQSIENALDRHDASGRPEVVAKIRALMELEAPYEEIWKIANSDVEKMVFPEKPGDIIPHPPFTGRGSTLTAWMDFARKVSDMEPEVIASMERNDLITVLVDRGIIEGPDFELLGQTEDKAETKPAKAKSKEK